MMPLKEMEPLLRTLVEFDRLAKSSARACADPARAKFYGKSSQSDGVRRFRELAVHALGRSGHAADRRRLDVEPSTAALLVDRLHAALRADPAGARRAGRHVQQGAADHRLPRSCWPSRRCVCAVGVEFRDAGRRSRGGRTGRRRAWFRLRSRSSAIACRSAQRQVAIGRILFAIMTGNLLGASGAGVHRRSVRLARCVLSAWRLSVSLVLAVAVPGLRGIGERRRALRSVDTRAELSRHLPQSAGEDLFRRGVSRSASSCTACSRTWRRCCSQDGETRASIAGVVIAGFAIGGASYTLVVVRRLLRMARRTMDDACRRRRHGICLAVIAIACAMAGRIRQFHIARLRLLHAARCDPGLCHRTGADRARLGTWRYIRFSIPRTGERAGRLRSGHRASSVIIPVLLFGAGVFCGCRIGLRRAVTPSGHRSSRVRDRARRPGRAPRRPSAIGRPARTRRSGCRRADTSSRRCAAISA